MFSNSFRIYCGIFEKLCTSALTLAEVLVKPVQAGRLDLPRIYESALLSQAVLLAPFDAASARIFAQVRRDRAIKPPDAIQLSCAAHLGCDLFITNDDRLSRKVIPGIQFITSLDRAFV